MAKFRKKGGKGTPGISTASLPDIIFMLLFFFMVTTTMREATLLVRITPAQATEVQKLEKKSLVDYIYIGPPLKKQLGTDSRIQLNDQFATEIKDITEKGKTNPLVTIVRALPLSRFNAEEIEYTYIAQESIPESA